MFGDRMTPRGRGDILHPRIRYCRIWETLHMWKESLKLQPRIGRLGIGVFRLRIQDFCKSGTWATFCLHYAFGVRSTRKIWITKFGSSGSAPGIIVIVSFCSFDCVHRSISCILLRIHLQHTGHLNCIVLFFGPQFNWNCFQIQQISFIFAQ